MPKTVVKFGGSNLKCKEDISRVIQVVKNYKQPVVIVVSAFFGVTNYLIESLEKARHDEQVAKKTTNYLFNLKKETLELHIQDSDVRNNILSDISILLDELEKYLHGIYLTGDASPALEDHVLAFGERISAVFLNGILNNEGIDAKVAFPEEIGLITDGEFGDASVDFVKSINKVREALTGELVNVVPGFYGLSSDGKTTLLGRGGSDYSAAAIARCIGASSLDIWKDVNGFLSADPGIVDNPVQIQKLTYDEAAELAYFGAKILHPRTVEPLCDPHIPIRIFNIYGVLNVQEPLTVVSAEKIVTKCIVKSVTYSDDFGILKLKGSGVGAKPGILAKVTTALLMAGINISSVLTSQTSINFLISRKDLSTAYSVVSAIDLPVVGRLQVVENITVIAAVGNGIAENFGIAARIFSSLAKHEINVLMSCSGASLIVSYILVGINDRTQAVKAIHREFFETIPAAGEL
ncbi:MAG: aspartate kinase [Bacteroidia bacterium]|nr:aspartate kinase [Bacteroidia bacterium]